jgi:hypothetical protein
VLDGRRGSEVPAGNVTTASSGALSPPLLKIRAIRASVVKPSRPGTENCVLNALVDDPTVAIPTIVTSTQNDATMRLCARTQRVTDPNMLATSTVRLRDI